MRRTRHILIKGGSPDERKQSALSRAYPGPEVFDKWQGLFYLIPWIIGFVVFKAIPFGQSLYYSFTDMDFFNGIHQYGIMNYVDAFTTPKITKALITTSSSTASSLCL